MQSINVAFNIQVHISGAKSFCKKFVQVIRNDGYHCETSLFVVPEPAVAVK